MDYLDDIWAYVFVCDLKGVVARMCTFIVITTIVSAMLFGGCAMISDEFNPVGAGVVSVLLASIGSAFTTHTLYENHV